MSETLMSFFVYLDYPDKCIALESQRLFHGKLLVAAWEEHKNMFVEGRKSCLFIITFYPPDTPGVQDCRIAYYCG